MRPRTLALATLATALLAAPAAEAAAIVITTPGAKAPLRCSPSKRTVEIDAAEVTVTITGYCKSIAVNGARVRVKASIVDSISVTGSGSRVSYLRRSGGGRARVSITGVDSRVSRR